MPTVIDALVVTLGLDSSGFNAKQKEAVQYLRNLQEAADKHVKPARKAVGEFEQGLSLVQGRLLQIAGIFMGGMGIAAFTDHITKLTAQTGYLARNLGMSVKELSAWQGAGASVGATAEDIAASIAHIVSQQKEFIATGRSPLMSFMGQVGLNRSGSSTDILMRLSEWASKHADPAYATHLLKSRAGLGEGMVNLLMKGPDEVRKQRDQYEKYGPSAEEVKNFQALQEAMAKAAASATALGRALVNMFSPELLRIMQGFARISDAFRDKGVAEGVGQIGEEAAKGAIHAGEAIAPKAKGLYERTRRWWRGKVLNDPAYQDGGDDGGGLGGSGEDREGRMTNVLLRDIRDILKGEQMGSGPAGPGGGGLTFRRGITTRGNGGGGSGGRTPGSNDIGQRKGGNVRGGYWTDEKQQYAVDYLTKNSDMPEVSARALVARWAAVESTGAGPNAINPKSGAAGTAQWLGSRKHSFKLGDLDSQLAKTIREYKGIEPGEGQMSGRLLKAAKTEEEAALAASAYERAEGFGKYSDPRRDNFTDATLRHMRRMKKPEPSHGASLYDRMLRGKGEKKPWSYAPAMPASGARGRLLREGNSTVNTNTSSTHIGEMNVTVPPGGDPAAYGAGIQQHLERFNNIQNANTGMV